MPDGDKRYYNPQTTSLWFGVCALLLFIVMVWVFVDDYAREWKLYQREFRALEVEKSRTRLKEEQSVTQDAAYQEGVQKIVLARDALARQGEALNAAEAQCDSLAKELAKANQDYQFTKADFDAVKYQVEALHAHGTESELQLAEARYAELEQTLTEQKKTVDQAQAAYDTQKKSLDAFYSELKNLEREQGKLTKQMDLLERKLKKIDPEAMSLGARLGSIVRDFPGLDFLAPDYRVRQTVVKGVTEDVSFAHVPRVDRCETCHQGIARTGFEEDVQPFTSHPRMDLFLSSDSPHPVEEFGCTVCHRGRGRGTDFNSTVHMPSTPEQKEAWQKAHDWEKMHHWSQPMLPQKFTEASCLQCHTGEIRIPGADKVSLGLFLIDKSGCYSCHKIERFSGRPKRGPSLTHISAKTKRDWTYRWIEDPKSYRHNTWMPSFFNLSNNSDPESRKRIAQEIHAIVTYLYAHDEPFELETMPMERDILKGKELFASTGCLGCHKIEKEEVSHSRKIEDLYRDQGPNLLGLGSKTTEAWLYNWIKKPWRYDPGTRMPDLKLKDRQVADIASYLMVDRADDFASKEIPAVNEKDLDPIVLGFLRKNLTDDAAAQELAAMDLESKLLFSGKKLIRHYGCFGCHDIKGFEDAKPIGTELSEIGSKPLSKFDFGLEHGALEHTNHAWFTEKLKSPRSFDAHRIKEADEKLKMPQFNFSDEEVEAVVAALTGLVRPDPNNKLVKPRTPENLFIEEGQRLVREFNCQGCHVIEGEGGAIQPLVKKWLVEYRDMDPNEAEAMSASFSPPDLIGEGKKVRTDWLYHFLDDPSIIRPWLEVKMPRFKMAADERNGLVRYFSYLDQELFPFAPGVDQEPTTEDIHAGKLLASVNYFDCFNCHIQGDKMPQGTPDRWAPNLALAQSRLKPNWIIDWVMDPQSLQPGTKMPTYFDKDYFDESGPEDILEGDEKSQIRVMRDYVLSLADAESSSDAKSE